MVSLKKSWTSTPWFHHIGLPKYPQLQKNICLRRLHLPQVAVPSEFTLEALRSFLDIEGDGLEAVRVAFRNLEALTDEISLQFG